MTDYTQTHYLHILIALLTILSMMFPLYRRKSRRKKLHQRNIHIAQQSLVKIKAIAEESPALVFGMLRNLNPFVFEELLLCAFKQQNYRIKQNLRYTGDHGIDGIVYDAQNRKYLIQAKRYKSAINPSHVQEFSNVIIHHRATAGFFIHTGRTGKKSYTLRGNNIHIISGSKLISLLVGKQFL